MRPTEKVTLHFDLNHMSHLPEEQTFHLKALGARKELRRHDDETREHHTAKNKALGAMSKDQRKRFTHFVEDVELPSDAVGFHWVGYSSANPNAVSDEIAVVFQHVPSDAVRRAVRAMKRDSSPTPPPLLAHYGVTAVPDGIDHEDLHVDASFHVNHIRTAQTILMQHPEIGTPVPELHYRIAHELVATVPSFTQLWQYLSTNPPDGDQPWYENTIVKDPQGNVMEPYEGPDAVDKDGHPVKWKTQLVNGKQVPVIPQHKLSDGLANAAKPVVQDVGKLVKQQPWLKGTHWTSPTGVTVKSRTNVPSSSTHPGPMTSSSLSGAPAAPKWAFTNLTDQYSLHLKPDSLTFDPVKKELSFTVNNWFNRSLGAHVQFLDAKNAPIDNPKGWQDQFPSWLPDNVKKWLEPNASKPYLRQIGAGNVCFGIAFPEMTAPTVLSFIVPDASPSVRILLGGLGNGSWDMDVDKVGLIKTCLVSYAVPLSLMALSVGATFYKPWNDFFDDMENVAALMLAAEPPMALALVKGLDAFGARFVFILAGEVGIGILLSGAFKKFAMKYYAYTSTQELLDQAPFVGWGLRILSIASSIADMLDTSLEVALSPATYTLELKSSMALRVVVKPDQTKATETQGAIWPKNKDHYAITVQIKGGTAMHITGPMTGADDAPIDVLFSKENGHALPSARGMTFQILAEIYSDTNWLCGKWVSGWIDAVPTDGDSRTETGSIIEQLVPLLPTTQYTQIEKLNYDGPSKSYVWEQIHFNMLDSLAGSFKAGPVPQAVADAFWSNGVRLSGSSSITVVDPASHWQVVDSGNGVTYDVTLVKTASGGKQLSVKNATHPVPNGNVTSLTGQDVRGLVDITINDLAYKLGYCYLAQKQDMPLDKGTDNQATPMYVTQSISTLDKPGAGMKSPTRGFSVQPYIAYDQFGPAGIFPLEPAETYMASLNAGGNVPAAVAAAFTGKGFPLPGGAQVKVVTADAAWQIGLPNQPALFDLRRQVDAIKVFKSPVPAFSPNNFYLDTRAHESTGLYHLRLINLHDDSGPTFDYDTRQSWGAFDTANLDAICVHPNGYVIGISYHYHKMLILKLPDGPLAEKDAPRALPFSGEGVREGLMRGPVGMTITADGRILVLERDNARVQAFDTQGNTVPCFASDLRFDTSPGFASDLDKTSSPIALLQELQRNVPVWNPNPNADDKRLLNTPLFSITTNQDNYVKALNAGTMTQDLRKELMRHALDVGVNAQIQTTAPNVWLIHDRDRSLTYDVRYNGERLNGIDVYRMFSPTITVKAPGSEWTLKDTSNMLVFEVKLDKSPGGALKFQRLSAYMKLKGGPSEATVYLDVAAETKGFIYVLSYVKPGDKSSDYRLDLYNPDGSPVTPDPNTSNGHINAAKMTVDQWRTVFSLNYEQMSGPGGRPQPTISQWIPSTPPGN